MVIVNYRTARLALEAVRSVIEHGDGGSCPRVVLVDNASPDGSASVLSEGISGAGWGDIVTLLRLECNGGFASGNNAGLRHFLDRGPVPDSFLLLNPDTVVLPGAITALVEHLGTCARAGIVGGTLLDATGSVTAAGRRRPSPIGEFLSGAQLGILDRLLPRYRVAMAPTGRPRRCDWVSGAALLVRRQVLEQIGLLDAGYFLYFEEVDLCDRARRAGWQVWHVPDSRIVHLEGASTGLNSATVRRSRYWLESRRRYLTRGYGGLGLLAGDVFWAAGRSSLLLRRALGLASSTVADCRWLSRDILAGDLRAFLTGDAGRRSRRGIPA